MLPSLWVLPKVLSPPFSALPVPTRLTSTGCIPRAHLPSVFQLSAASGKCEQEAWRPKERETLYPHTQTHPPHVLLPFLSALLQWLDSSPDTSPMEHYCPGPSSHRAAGTPLPSHTPLDLGMIRDDDGFLLD